MIPNKNILIISFNSQKLTDCAIKSINKHTPDCTIHVVDNGTTEKFVNTFDNVNLIDNTNEKLTKFDDVLKTIPDKLKHKANHANFASARHCYTIQMAIDMLDEPFVMIDSDALVKKDISELFREDLLYCGEVGRGKHIHIVDGKVDNVAKFRVFPYICYINAPMCKELGIMYFDKDYMHAIDGRIACQYDTGAAFLMQAEKYPHLDIKCSDYIEHLGAGSHGKKPDRIDSWLNLHKKLWD